MGNWKSMHECEDEWEAEWLHKMAMQSCESYFLTRSLKGHISETVPDVLMGYTLSKKDISLGKNIAVFEKSGWLSNRK